MPRESTLDRDELMFQSGWAAALASENKTPAAAVASRSRWAWPALTGTFATLSAALAIALFSPTASDGNPIANTSVVEIPELVLQPTQANPTIVDAADEIAVDQIDVPDSADQFFKPLVESVFRFQPSPSSVLAMRNRMLRTSELGEIVRPVVYNRRPRPQPVPLRANSFRNHQLMEQL